MTVDNISLLSGKVIYLSEIFSNFSDELFPIAIT